jgi:transposase
VTWAERYGRVERIGVEGTGTYGAGLTRFVRAYGLEAVEVNRPDRSLRRRRGKSDPIDAQAAARATQAGVAATAPKTREDQVEMIRVLRVARRGAMKARVVAAEQLYGCCTAPPRSCASRCSASRPRPWSRPAPPCGQDRSPARPPPPRPPCGSWPAAGNSSRPSLTQLDTQPQDLVSAVAPTLVALPGVGVDTAGQLLVTAGDNPQRLRGEAAFAHLCGTAPIPASSGRTHRHRLNRGGDRHANHALCASRWSACAATHRPGPMSSGGPTKACPSSTSCAV